MASPSPVPGAPRVRAGSPWWNRSKTSSWSAADTPGPSSTTSRTTSPSTTPTRSSTRERAWARALSSRFRTTRRSSLALARTGPADTCAVSMSVSPAFRARAASSSTTASRSTAEVTAGAPSSAAASTSRSSTSRSISPVAPSTSSRSTWASTAPGAARASSNETRWAVRGPCRSCETSATSRRCRCTEASTRDSIRFMVAARRPTSSRRPSSAILRSSWLWPMASTSARIWSSLDRARPRTNQITRASATRTSGPPTIRVRRRALVASCTASRLEPTTTVTSPSGVSPCWIQTR